MLRQYRRPLRFLFRALFLVNLAFIPVDFSFYRPEHVAPWAFPGDLRWLLMLRICILGPVTVFCACFVDSTRYPKSYRTTAASILSIGVCVVLYIWISAETLGDASSLRLW